LIFGEGYFGGEEIEKFEDMPNEDDMYNDEYSFYDSREEDDDEGVIDDYLVVEQKDDVDAALVGKHQVEQIDDPFDYYDDHDDLFFADTSNLNLKTNLRMLVEQDKVEKKAQEVQNKTEEMKPAPVVVQVENEESKIEENTEELLMIDTVVDALMKYIGGEAEYKAQHKVETELDNTEESFENIENEEDSFEEEAARFGEFVENLFAEETEYHYEEEQLADDILYDMINTDVITFIDAIHQLEKIVDKTANYTSFTDKLQAQQDLKIAFEDALKRLEIQPNATSV